VTGPTALSQPREPARRPFRSAVPFYVAGRLDYPSDLIADVAAALQLGKRARVLDLGCGPGFLALGFAALDCAVTAMDPEPLMLDAARRAAEAAGAVIDFVAGSSEDLGRPDMGQRLGRFDLVTMGRSFHWMDREKTLAALDALVEPKGGIAIFRDGHPECPENDWHEAWRCVRRRYAERTRHLAPPRSDPDSGHEDLLERSSFSVLECLRQRYRRRTGLAQMVDRALSMSSCSPERLGADRDAFETELREALAPYLRDGVIEETVEAEALLARRRGERRRHSPTSPSRYAGPSLSAPEGGEG
jgi:SAM-dependent methyltransferase